MNVNRYLQAGYHANAWKEGTRMVNGNHNDTCDFARQVISNPQYREAVMKRAIAGTLPESVEELIWECAQQEPPGDNRKLKLVKGEK